MEGIMDDVAVSNTSEETDKVHHWRICPIGKHYVKEHFEHIPPSKMHPGGDVIVRHAHCASNPLSKNKHQISDILSFSELTIITKLRFLELKGPPTAHILKYPRADEFDTQIRGWALYWNEVFEAKNPLDPNLVTALIASESGFDPNAMNPHNPKRIGPARGLMQLTDETLRILNGHKDGLRDHFIHFSHTEAIDSSANICAGTRWLFFKKAGAKERYAKIDPNHAVTWDDVVAEYKGVLSGILDKNNLHPDPEGKMKIFRSIYEKFQE